MTETHKTTKENTMAYVIAVLTYDPPEELNGHHGCIGPFETFEAAEKYAAALLIASVKGRDDAANVFEHLTDSEVVEYFSDGLGGSEYFTVLPLVAPDCKHKQGIAGDNIRAMEKFND